MAWEELTFACGHETRQQFYGPWRDRERRIEWLKTQPCAECRRQSVIEASKASGATARTQVEALGWGLPPLKGTDKQITWAQDLRATATVQLLKVVQEKFGDLAWMSVSFWLIEALAMLDKAKFWIDARTDLARALWSVALSLQMRDREHVNLLWKRDCVRGLYVQAVPVALEDWMRPEVWPTSTPAMALGKVDSKRVLQVLLALREEDKTETERRNAANDPEGRVALKFAQYLVEHANIARDYANGETPESALDRIIERMPQYALGQAQAKRLLVKCKDLIGVRLLILALLEEGKLAPLFPPARM